MAERTHCNKPDRDCPGIECGYPLPCPYHTFRVSIKRVEDAPKAVERVRRLARRLRGEKPR